jgi:hypothetical protein
MTSSFKSHGVKILSLPTIKCTVVLVDWFHSTLWSVIGALEEIYKKKKREVQYCLTINGGGTTSFSGVASPFPNNRHHFILFCTAGCASLVGLHTEKLEIWLKLPVYHDNLFDYVLCREMFPLSSTRKSYAYTIPSSTHLAVEPLGASAYLIFHLMW